MTTLFGVLLSAGGIAVAGWLFRARRDVAASFGGGGTAVALIAFAVLANAAPVLAGERSSAVIGVLVVGLLGWALVSRRRRPHGEPDTWQWVVPAIAAALLLWCFGVDLLSGDGLYGSRLPAYVASGLLLVVVWLLPTGGVLGTRAVAFTGLAVLALLTIPTLAYADAWRACTTGKLEKCSLAGGLFQSFYSSENYVALIASFTLVAVLCAMRGRELLAGAAFCAVVIVATGARTSLIALAAVGVWIVGALVLERRRAFRQLPWALCVALVVGALAAASYLTWSATPTTLSNRGNIWVTAREHIAGREAVGAGVSKWYQLRDLGEAPQHFFHSVYVLLLFSGGLVALALLGCWLVTLLRRPVDDGRAFTAKAPLVLFVIYSFTEVVWNPLSVDGLTWITVLLMMTRLSAAPGTAVRADGSAPATERPEQPAATPGPVGGRDGGAVAPAHG
ncbi:O-antigen ligase family protein [Micromonospora auratinigra]|uniref:O-antigen ligase like membrane protein n=1 Tax=Micromonospora auratinigra TaxID=261654 RepID=A0A1A9A963_9ACTN|nr:O-antigen ligase family protein [Micromonospora auratinigra]SBT52707.1 O-antigen ligase like membrane protein [Micromonospora auratinigra]